MADPIRIPLSQTQQARLAQINAERAVLDARINEAAAFVVSQDHDPVALVQAGWKIAIQPTEIVLTPPSAASPVE